MAISKVFKMGELLQGWSQNKLMYKVPSLTQRASLANSREIEVNPFPLSPESQWDQTDPPKAPEERWAHPHRYQPSLVLPWYHPYVFLSLLHRLRMECKEETVQQSISLHLSTKWKTVLESTFYRKSLAPNLLWSRAGYSS